MSSKIRRVADSAIPPPWWGIGAAEKEVSDRFGRRLTVAFEIKNPGAQPARSLKTEDFILADKGRVPKTHLSLEPAANPVHPKAKSLSSPHPPLR